VAQRPSALGELQPGVVTEEAMTSLPSMFSAIHRFAASSAALASFSEFHALIDTI
jgi:hypothetical protein